MIVQTNVTKNRFDVTLLLCRFFNHLLAKIVKKIERQGKSGNNSCLRAIYRTLAK